MFITQCNGIKPNILYFPRKSVVAQKHDFFYTNLSNFPTVLCIIPFLWDFCLNFLRTVFLPEKSARAKDLVFRKSAKGDKNRTPNKAKCGIELTSVKERYLAKNIYFHLKQHVIYRIHHIFKVHSQWMCKLLHNVMVVRIMCGYHPTYWNHNNNKKHRRVTWQCYSYRELHIFSCYNVTFVCLIIVDCSSTGRYVCPAGRPQ